MAANRNYVTKNKDKLQRFLRGWYRGLEYVLAHKSEAVPIMAKAFQLPPEEFEAIMGWLRFIGKEEAKRLLGADGTRGEFYEISKYEEELWQKAGVTKKPVDPTLAYTGEIIAGAR